MQARGIEAPGLLPMVRGRLVQHNGDAVTGETYAERGQRARRLAEREFNLSWAQDLAADGNPVVAGRAWDPAGTAPEVSVEQGIAETLGWSLGDRIAFDVAGRVFEAEITSLREVTWEGFRPNFFVIANAPALQDSAASYITAVNVPRRRCRVHPCAGRALPQCVGDRRRRHHRAGPAHRAPGHAGGRVRVLLHLGAGLLVLVAAVTSSQDERLLEGGVMRVLGARGLQLRLAQASEFLAIGIIAGGIAALAATGLTALVADIVFELPFAPDWGHVGIGFGAGVLAVVVTGLAATRRVVSTPPAITLRALQG
jgi:putative ABC transport system permease protein